MNKNDELQAARNMEADCTIGTGSGHSTKRPMPRAKMLAALRELAVTADDPGTPARAFYEQTANELERLGVIADAAEVLLRAEGRCIEPCCVCASAKAFAELRRIVTP